MSTSLTPSRGSSFFPGFPRWSDIERDIDRDITRMHRMFTDAAHQILPNKEGVHHRKPNLTYDENHHQLEIEIELPGVAKENVSIDLQGDTISLSAKRYKTLQIQSDTQVPVEGKTQTQQNGDKTDPQMTQDDDDEIKKEQPAALEQPALSVHYQVSIPIGNKFDIENISATMLGDGILTMIVPKKVEHATSSRMIEIGSV